MMSERAKNLVAVILGAGALVVIVAGLAGGSDDAPTRETRVATLSAVIKCPFCNGESLADSASGVAGDYRALIADMVDSGFSDRAIIDEFAANFGSSYILDSSGSSWSLALWILPLLALLGGAGVVVSMRRSAKQRDESDVDA